MWLLRHLITNCNTFGSISNHAWKDQISLMRKSDESSISLTTDEIISWPANSDETHRSYKDVTLGTRTTMDACTFIEFAVCSFLGHDLKFGISIPVCFYHNRLSFYFIIFIWRSSPCASGLALSVTQVGFKCVWNLSSVQVLPSYFSNFFRLHSSLTLPQSVVVFLALWIITAAPFWVFIAGLITWFSPLCSYHRAALVVFVY